MANWLVENATQGIFCQTSVYAQFSTRDEKQTKLLSDEKVAMGLMRISPLRKIKKILFHYPRCIDSSQEAKKHSTYLLKLSRTKRIVLFSIHFLFPKMSKHRSSDLLQGTVARIFVSGFMYGISVMGWALLLVDQCATDASIMSRMGLIQTCFDRISTCA